MVNAGAGRARGRAPARGYTLIELLVVVAILTAVMGMSIGIYRRVAVQNILPAAASQVSSTIRAARNYSVSAGLPSRVHIDAEEQTITAFGYEIVAGWSFEDLDAFAEGQRIPAGREYTGAFGERAEVQGVVEVGDGRIGRCIVLLDEGASLVAERRPRYDAPRGFSLEAWALLWPRPLEKGEGSDRRGAWSDPRRSERFAVISRPGAWEMGLLGDGSLYAVIGDADRPESSETFSVATASHAVLGNRWAHLRASFDGIELLLEVDGIEREWSPEGFERVDPRDWPPLPERVPPSDHELMVSHPNRFFYGALDEVKVRVALEPRTYRLPSEVEFLGPSRLIRFDSRGSLDPVHHSLPVLVRVAEVGEDAPGDPLDGDRTGTAVAEPAPPDDPAEVAAPPEEDLGDPVAAVARYLEEIAARPEGELDGDTAAAEDPDTALPGEGDADAASRARGVKRIHRIIVDLTGTIRG